MRHIEKVKSYAPRVLHLVADLHIQQSNQSISSDSNVNGDGRSNIDSTAIHSMTVGATVGAVVPDWDKKRSNKVASTSSTKLNKDNSPSNSSRIGVHSDTGASNDINMPELDEFDATEGLVPVIEMKQRSLASEEQVNMFLRAATNRRIPVIFRALDVGPAVGKFICLPDSLALLCTCSLLKGKSWCC